MTRPAATVAEWLTWVDTIPHHGGDETASDEPSPTSQTPRDEDGLLAEDAWARQIEWFAA